MPQPGTRGCAGPTRCLGAGLGRWGAAARAGRADAEPSMWGCPRPSAGCTGDSQAAQSPRWPPWTSILRKLKPSEQRGQQAASDANEKREAEVSRRERSGRPETSWVCAGSRTHAIRWRCLWALHRTRHRGPTRGDGRGGPVRLRANAAFSSAAHSKGVRPGPPPVAACKLPVRPRLGPCRVSGSLTASVTPSLLGEARPTKRQRRPAAPASRAVAGRGAGAASSLAAGRAGSSKAGLGHGGRNHAAPASVRPSVPHALTWLWLHTPEDPTQWLQQHEMCCLLSPNGSLVLS